MTADHNDDIYTKSRLCWLFIENRYDDYAAFWLIMSDVPECPRWARMKARCIGPVSRNRRSIVTIHRRAGRMACWRFRKKVGCFALREQGGFVW